MLELLRSGAPAAMPLLPHLLRARGAGDGGSRPGSSGLQAPSQQKQKQQFPAAQQEQELAAAPGSPCYSCSDAEDDAEVLAVASAAAEGLLESPLVQAERISKQFGLNEEQAEVMHYVAGWCSLGAARSSGGAGGGSARKAAAGAAAAAAVAAEGEPQAPPVCLIHGPFGSGGLLHPACWNRSMHLWHAPAVLGASVPAPPQCPTSPPVLLTTHVPHLLLQASPLCWWRCCTSCCSSGGGRGRRWRGPGCWSAATQTWPWIECCWVSAREFLLCCLMKPKKKHKAGTAFAYRTP